MRLRFITSALAAGLLSLTATTTSAQQATVVGTVVDAEDETLLTGVNVLLEGEDGLRRGQASGRDGAFAFVGLLPGRYALAASFLGYETLRDTLDIGFSDRVEVALRLVPEETEMEAVTVEATATTTTSSPAGLVQITAADLAVIPSPDIGGDLASVLGVQPGVVTLGDRGGQLFIRGGTPTQNLVLVDGMRLFQPFHIVGFYSAFPAEIVQRADVYAGGFGARFGGRISSVVDVTTRNGNKKRFGASASVAPFLTSLRVEGPVVRDEVSVVASVRESVVERVAAEVVGEPLPYRFGDVFAKLHAFTGPASFVTVSGLRTTDRGTLAGGGGASRIAWTNEALGGRFFYLPTKVAAALDVTVNYAAYRSTYEPERTAPREADARSFGGQFGMAYFFDGAEVRFGFGGQTLTFDYSFDRADPDARDRENTTEGHFYLESDFDLGRGVRLEPGIRFQTFPSQRRNLSVEPRLRASWAATHRATLSAALGIYRQEIIGLTDERDIGDVFTAWSALPQNAPTPTARHAILGLELRPRPWLTFGAEVYGKYLDDMQVLVGGRGLERANGDVAGLDLRAEWRRAPLYLLATYGFSAAEYRNSLETYRPPHDRRHRLQVVGEVQRGPFRLALRWQLTSGRPFTRLRGVFDALGTPGPDGEFTTAPGSPTVLTEDAPFRGLTPSYHRLDVSVERDVPFRTAILTLQASVVNAYDRDNFFFYDAFRGERVDQFPLIPSLGLRVEVR